MKFVIKCVAGLALAALGPMAVAQNSGWSEEQLAAAQGSEVYWNAWGGDERINAYIDWVGDSVEAQYGIQLNHVKLSNTADAVARIRTEVESGNTLAGSVDLIWINGENFAAMKREDLLHGPFAATLPSYAAFAGSDAPVFDFTIPTEGYESPWGRAQLNFMVDTAYGPASIQDLDALLGWTTQNPGRFSYPRPPDFIGSTFLKQVLVEKANGEFANPFTGDADSLEPVFTYLDALHPTLWRKGNSFPASGPVLRDMLANTEVDVALSFNPYEAASLVQNQEVDASVRAVGLESGTIANMHFVAIPTNSDAKQAAEIVADFLLSPVAQARKADLDVWGDPTVLDLDRLSDEEAAGFSTKTVDGDNLGPQLQEPHPSWMEALEAAWEARYGS